MSGLTTTQRAALKALIDHGGEGVLTKTRTMLARGAILGHGDDGEADRDAGIECFQWSTWKALIAAGQIREVAPRRYRAVTA